MNIYQPRSMNFRMKFLMINLPRDTAIRVAPCRILRQCAFLPDRKYVTLRLTGSSTYPASVMTSFSVDNAKSWRNKKWGPRKDSHDGSMIQKWIWWAGFRLRWSFGDIFLENLMCFELMFQFKKMFIGKFVQVHWNSHTDLMIHQRGNWPR